jgi:hypothetical protein
VPGTPYMSLAYPAYSSAYAAPAPLEYGPSHGQFIVWLVVFALASVAILGGLKVGGFSFVFRTR